MVSQAKQHGAAGIIEGLRHFGFLTEELDGKRKIESDIYASLDSRIRNQPSPGSMLSESFVWEKYMEEVKSHSCAYVRLCCADTSKGWNH